jgi:hypothetical protein
MYGTVSIIYLLKGDSSMYHIQASESEGCIVQ